MTERIFVKLGSDELSYAFAKLSVVAQAKRRKQADVMEAGMNWLCDWIEEKERQAGRKFGEIADWDS